MKAIWICTALIVLVCGIVVSRPEVRGWMDERFPSLGINGKAARENNLATLDPASLNGAPGIVNIDYPNNPSDPSAPGLGSPTLPPQSSFPQSGLPLPSLPPVGSEITNNQVPGLSPPPSGQLPTYSSVPTATPYTSADGSAAPKAGRRTPDGRLIADFATLDFVRRIDVVAQADGIITELSVDDGSYIMAGAPILKLDSRIAEAEVMVQTRELEQAKLKAENTAQIEFAEAANKKAKIEVGISEELFRKNSEDANALRAKVLEAKKTELQIKVSKIEHAQEQAAVTVSQAKLDAANVQIALRTITAPWNGFVSEVSKRQYSYVRAGEIVCTLCDLSKMRVKGVVTADIPPNLLYGAAASVKITIANGIEKEIQGKVMYVSYETKASQQYPVWVEIDNEQLPDGQFLLRKGMVASLIIQPNT